MSKAKTRKFEVSKYSEYVEKFKSICQSQNRTIPCFELRTLKINLPDARWFVAHCPDKNVTTYAEFVDWCGFVSRRKVITKEKAAALIYKMAEEKGRPLVYDDFRGTGCYQISPQRLRDLWGSLNAMKRELGLEIVQERMDTKHVLKDDFLSYIECMVNELCKNKDFIITSEIDRDKRFLSSTTLQKLSYEYYGKTLSQILESYGIKTGHRGRGFVHTFEDNEKTDSYYEYMFSSYLREHGLIFNKDYYRNIKYSSLDVKYNGNLNCDYLIINNNESIYVEIAGILESYKEWYYSNKEICTSRTKEKYRLLLHKKESMLINNCVKYFILFPCDLTQENFAAILNHPSLALKEKIENFNKNNINWSKIRSCGELKYSTDTKWGRNPILYS